MKAFIWDLDGTLLDSYGVIVSSVVDACGDLGVAVDREEAHRQVIQHSVTWYLETVSKDFSVPFESLHAQNGRKHRSPHLHVKQRRLLIGNTHPAQASV